MLSHEEIIKRCQSPGCFIVKNYDAEGMRVIPIKDRQDGEAKLEPINDNALKAVRMSITLGPVVKKRNVVIKKEHRFKKQKNLIDLAACGGSLVLGPRETISVLSNEYFRFDGSIAALIIPRLTLADVGVSLIPTYIDPYWNGILQMSLVNNTSSAFELKLGESIAQCFFFDVSGEVPIVYKDSFPRKSHHFGQTWEKIIQEDAEPFPTQKRIGELAIFAKIRYLTQSSKAVITALVTTGLLFTGLFAAGQLYNSVSHAEKQLEILPELREQIANIKGQQEQDSKRLVTKGFLRLTIDASKQSAAVQVPVNIAVVGNPVILSDISDKSKVSIFEVKTGRTENSVLKEIDIFVQLSEVAKLDTVLDVNWVVIP